MSIIPVSNSNHPQRNGRMKNIAGLFRYDLLPTLRLLEAQTSSALRYGASGLTGWGLRA